MTTMLHSDEQPVTSGMLPSQAGLKRRLTLSGPGRPPGTANKNSGRQTQLTLRTMLLILSNIKQNSVEPPLTSHQASSITDNASRQMQQMSALVRSSLHSHLSGSVPTRMRRPASRSMMCTHKAERHSTQNSTCAHSASPASSTTSM
jgi:hypothetical protein